MTRRSATLVRWIGVTAWAMAMWSARAGAIERKPLPLFTLTSIDGSPARSTDLAREGRWLLIYVRPACAPCDTLLQTIDPEESPSVATRAVIVVGGVDTATAARLALGFKQLTGATWFADRDGAMQGALPLAGAPVVFGMRGSTVEWSLAGVVPDAGSMRTALRSWTSRSR